MKGPVQCGLDTLGESLVGRGGEWISNMASDVSVMKRNFYLNQANQAGAPAAAERASPSGQAAEGTSLEKAHWCSIF